MSRHRRKHRPQQPKEREHRSLSLAQIIDAVASVGMNVETKKVEKEKGLVVLSVSAPSGKTFSRQAFFHVGDDFESAAARAVRQALLGFEKQLGGSRYDLRKTAPNLDELADVNAAYSAFFGAAGALLRAEAL